MKKRGAALVETVMLMPILAALLIGTVSLARITYTYYMLEKLMFNLARYLGTQQGVNFCDNQDATMQSALNYALTGDPTSSDNPVIIGLTPAMFQVRVERFDSTSQQLVDASGDCSSGVNVTPPEFIVVSLTNPYTMPAVFWGLPIDTVPLNPSVRVPYAGT
jgi:Flp pilus assembly protein TadG